MIEKKSVEEITEDNYEAEAKEIYDTYSKLDSLLLKRKLFFVVKELREAKLELNKPSKIENLKERTIWLLIAVCFGVLVTPSLYNLFGDELITSWKLFLDTLVNNSFLIKKIVLGWKFLYILMEQASKIILFLTAIVASICLPAYAAEIVFKKEIEKNVEIQKLLSIRIDHLNLEKQIIESLIK